MELCVHNIEDKIKENNSLISYYANNFNHSLEIYKQIEEFIYRCVHKLGNHDSDSLAELTKNLNIIVEKENLKLSWRWFASLVLESPRVTRELHFKILNYLIPNGITRNYYDFKETSSSLIICIFLCIENDLNNKIKELINDCLSFYDFNPNIFDALAIDLFFDDLLETISSKLKEKQCKDCFRELIEFSYWLKPLLNNSSISLPQKDNNLTKRFYECSAFRGLRRHFSRIRGKRMGQDFLDKTLSNSEFELAIEPWLMPIKLSSESSYLDGQIVLLIEWYLAFIHYIENRLRGRKRNISDSLIITNANKSIENLKKNISDYIYRIDNSDRFLNWLESVNFSFPYKTESL